MSTRARRIKDRIFKATILSLSLLTLLPLLLILITIISKGYSAISLDFFTKLPTPPGDPGGGILNSIVGSLLLIAIAVVISVPTGVGLGLYLSETRGPWASLVEILINTLQGIPSIVVGILAYLWIVKPLGGFSALSGGVALAIIMLPTVARATQETLIRLPTSLKEAGLSLGASYTRTIWKVILPSAMPGILSGVLLGVARIAGETAPLLFTAFGNPYLNLNPLKPVDAVPLLVFNYAMSPYSDWHQKAWGASLVLMVFILGINITIRKGPWKRR